jgi:hypothetical protein
MVKVRPLLALFFYFRAVFDQQPLVFERIDRALFVNQFFFSSTASEAVPESGLRLWFSRTLRQIKRVFQTGIGCHAFPVPRANRFALSSFSTWKAKKTLWQPKSLSFPYAVCEWFKRKANSKNR